MNNKLSKKRRLKVCSLWLRFGENNEKRNKRFFVLFLITQLLLFIRRNQIVAAVHQISPEQYLVAIRVVNVRRTACVAAF